MEPTIRTWYKNVDSFGEIGTNASLCVFTQLAYIPGSLPRPMKLGWGLGQGDGLSRHAMAGRLGHQAIWTLACMCTSGRTRIQRS